MPPSHGSLLTIGQVAKRAGLRVSALRYYESVGLIEPARRVGGKRRYDPSVFEPIALVQLAQDAGFSIPEIRRLQSGFERTTPASARWRAMVERKLDDVDARIARAQAMKSLLQQLLRCRCETLGQCVAKRVTKLLDAPN